MPKAPEGGHSSVESTPNSPRVCRDVDKAYAVPLPAAPMSPLRAWSGHPTQGYSVNNGINLQQGMHPPAFPLDNHKHNAYFHRHSAYTSWRRGIVVSKKRQTVTDAELAVLKVLWARGPLTAKAITEEVYPEGAESEFAAIHSFLQRLERKGLVARDRSSFVHVFSPAASSADVLGQELKMLAERLGGNSIAPLIMQLIAQKRLSRKELAEIRKLLETHSK
jgi:BlaI family penicillinase repressor